MKDLILSTSFGFTRDHIEPFLQSLRATGFSGDIVFFVASTSAETKAWLKSEGVKVIPFFYPYKNWNRLRNPLHYVWPFARPLISAVKRPGILSRICAPFQNLTSLRYLLYHRYLRSMAGRYRFVLLTDLRDVYFQTDPFIQAQPGKLRVYVEEANYTLGTSPDNGRWIREALGDEVLAKLVDKPVVCSGTTIGDQNSMQHYLDAFVTTVGKTLSTMRIGSDQGIHNVLVHTELSDSVTLCANRTSEILTMGLMPRDENFPRNDKGEFVDSAGIPYAVLHQYDRHADVKREILARSSFTRPPDQ